MTRGKHTAVGCALPLAAFYIGGCYGGSTGNHGSPPSDGGLDTRPRVEAGTPEEAGPDPDAGPAFGPDGWIRDDSFDPICGFYVPPSKEKLPPPIAWGRPAASHALHRVGWLSAGRRGRRARPPSRVGDDQTLHAHAEQLYSWADGSLIQSVWLGPSDPGQVGEYSYQGDALFLTAGNAYYARIKIFTPANGVRDFISFGNVISKSAADFATDGVNMAWIEASGRSTSTDPWTALTIMTAPFTTDPSTIVKRRLRSEDTGYFATAEFIVRLAEGAS